ncbi:MAG: site-specific integrase, partial [Nitrososphaeria archaeon]
KGDIEHRYTLNKRLPSNLIEEMRNAYKRAQKFLQTKEAETKDDIVAMLRKQLLLVAGFKPEEIKEEYLNLSDEEFQELIRKNLSSFQLNGTKQRIASLDELEGYLEQGWEFVAMLPNNKAIVKLRNETS